MMELPETEQNNLISIEKEVKKNKKISNKHEIFHKPLQNVQLRL